MINHGYYSLSFHLFFLPTTEADNNEMLSAQKIISKPSSTNLLRG